MDAYLDSHGTRLRFRDEGRGFPVVWLHGWALDLQMWEPQAAGLRQDYRIIRMDRRGFGASSGTPSLRSDPEDLLRLLEHLDIERCALVGMSQGARAVLRAACGPQAPRITCIILDGAPLEGTAASDLQAQEVPLARFAEIVRSRGLPAFRREWARHPLMQLRTRNPDMHALLRSIIERYPGRDLMQPAAADLVPLHPVSVAQITVPALVLNGEFDTPQRKRAGEELCRALPHSRRRLVPDAAHLANLDNPGDYNRFVTEFLRLHVTA